MRRYRKSTSTAPRTIVVKFAGKCRCCGGDIAAGELADYYHAMKAIGHVGALDGNSPRCTAELRNRADFVRDPGEDAADRWNETYGDRY